MTFIALPSYGQMFHYVEPGLAACPVAPVSTSAAPKVVSRGMAVTGRIHVRCGLDQGSYTVTLNSSDSNATFLPKTFLVNFGRIVGNGRYAVTFSNLGVQSVSPTVTSNMGSPPAQGYFFSSTNGFDVVMRRTDH